MWRLLFVSLFPALLVAQTSPDRLPVPTIRVSSRIVYVDIVVRDSRGQVVHGLTQDDFRVTEDGVPQKIDLFRAYTHEPADAPPSPAAVLPVDGLAFSNALAASKSSDTVNIILFDLLDTAMANQTYARKQMLKFLTALPPGHRIALFVLSDRLHMLQSFTGSSELLAQSAGLLLPKSSFLFKSEAGQARDADILGMSDSTMKSGGAESFAMNLAEELSNENFQHDQVRNDVVNNAFRELAQATSVYTGRKNLIWLSESFPVGAISTLQSFHSALGSPFVMAGLGSDGATSKAILDSRIAVYPISVAGLESGGVSASLNGVTAAAGNGAALAGGGTAGNGINTVDPELAGGIEAGQPGGQTGGARLPDTLGQQAGSRQALRDQLDDIAQLTGGQAFVGTNDLAGAMRKSLEGGENYYSLAYSPANRNWNGKFRKIRVDLTLKGYSLSYRRGYLALAESKETPAGSGDNGEELMAALQPVTPELDTIPVQSRIYPPNRQRATLQVDALIGSKAIRFGLAPDGYRTAKLLIGLVAIPESAKSAVAGQTSETLNFHLSEAQYRVSVGSGLPVRLEVPLKPGRYLVRLGVSDMNSHRIGTLDMPVEIPPV